MELHKFEITRLISARALQISMGAPLLVKAKSEDTPIDIAEKEFEKKLLPLAVIRSFPDGSTERVSI